MNEMVSPKNAAEIARGGKPVSAWTPELKMVWIKEIVAAILGIALVGSTIALVAYSLTLSPTKMPLAAPLVQVLVGLTGVVLGYYFARIPADARASLAQQRADSATAEVNSMHNTMRTMARKIDDMANQLRDGKMSDMAEVEPKLRQMADQMTEM